MLMAMSNAEKCLLHTKSGHLKKKNVCRATSPAFLKTGRRVLTSDIFKKSQAF